MIVYKFRSLEPFSYVYDIIVNNRVYCPNYHQLNDPFEGEFMNSIHIASVGMARVGLARVGVAKASWEILDGKQSRLCSFSRGFEDVRMWSFYADSHRGVCIEFELEGYPENQLCPIEYNLGPKEVTNPELTDTTIRKILSRKSPHWEYEKEVRLFSESEFHTIRGRVRRVLVGKRCEVLHEEMIRRIAGEIPVARVEISQEYHVVVGDEPSRTSEVLDI